MLKELTYIQKGGKNENAYRYLDLSNTTCNTVFGIPFEPFFQNFNIFPVGIWCQNDVVLTSMRHNYVGINTTSFYVMCPLGSCQHDHIPRNLVVTDIGQLDSFYIHAHSIHMVETVNNKLIYQIVCFRQRW